MQKARVILFATVFLDLVGFGMIIPLHPYLARDMGASASEVGMLMAVYSLMQFLFAPLWGQLSDRIGRRPVILISLFTASLGHLGFAFASELWGLFAARIIAGVGGANIPTAMAYMADISPEKSRTQAMGLIGAAFGMGFVMGPLLGGLSIPIGLELGTTPPFGESFGALLASALCFVNFLFALILLAESHVPSATARASFPSLRARINSLSSYVVRAPYSQLLGVQAIYMLAFAQIEATLFLFVADRFGWNVTTASFGFAYVGILMAAVQGGLIRWLVPRFGEIKLISWGLSLLMIGMLGIAGATGPTLLFFSVTVLGLGSGLLSPALSGRLSQIAPSSAQGEVLGVHQSLASLGRIFGPVLGGGLYHWIGSSAPFVSGACMLSLAFVWWKWREPKNSSNDAGIMNTFFEIGSFQFENILSQPLRFQVLNLVGPLDRFELPKQFWTANIVEVNVSVSDYATYAEKIQGYEAPIIIVCENGSLSKEWAASLSKDANHQIYWLMNGRSSLYSADRE